QQPLPKPMAERPNALARPLVPHWLLFFDGSKRGSKVYESGHRVEEVALFVHRAAVAVACEERLHRRPKHRRRWSEPQERSTLRAGRVARRLRRLDAYRRRTEWTVVWLAFRCSRSNRHGRTAFRADRLV